MANPFTVEDLYLHRKISEIHCTQDPSVAACTVRSIDRDADEYISRIWSYSLEDGSVSQLTHGPGRDKCPQWSPKRDQLAFISDRGGTSQVYLLPRSGGEARQCGEFAGAVSDLKWTPDGRLLIVTAAVEVDPDWRGERANGRTPAKRKASSPEVAWRLPYKSDGMGYLLAREIHLFSLSVETGEIRQLTDGGFDVVAFGISTDGKHIAYSRTREGRFAHRTDLWRCGIDGSKPVQLTHELAIVMEPVWSPDGSHIAFAGSEAEGDAQANLWLVDRAGHARRLGSSSVCIEDPKTLYWDPDGRSVLFAEAFRGRHRIVRMGLESKEPQVLVDGDLQFGAYCPAGERLAYTAEHPAQPSELYACDSADGGNGKQLSDLNAWWRERTPIRADAREFRVPDGKGGTKTIEGWLLYGQDHRGPMPLLNDVHGGPASYALLDFDTNVFWQVLCSRGWAVLALNAVGSSTYGREFCDRLLGRWGEADLPQHLAAIDQLQAAGICDDRVAIAGKSYGGS